MKFDNMPRIECLILPFLLSSAACSQISSDCVTDKCKREIEIADRESIVAYITKVHGWAESGYCIEKDQNSNGELSFVVVREPHSAVAVPGGGDSFELQVDEKTHKVTKELGFE